MYCTANGITQALVVGHMIGLQQNHLCYSLYLFWNDRASHLVIICLCCNGLEYVFALSEVISITDSI